jgi:hypothetical protein
MARLRDGGSGCPSHWMRARREAQAIFEKLDAHGTGCDCCCSALVQRQREGREQIVEMLVRAIEAEELLEQLTEQHEACGECRECSHKLECPRCEGEPVCSACGDVVGPVVCRDCCPEEDAA